MVDLTVNRRIDTSEEKFMSPRDMESSACKIPIVANAAILLVEISNSGARFLIPP